MPTNNNSNKSIPKPIEDASLDYIGGNYRSNLSDPMMDSTDDSVSINSMSSRATIVESYPNYQKSNSILNDGSLTELSEESNNLLDYSNKSGKSTKRSNNDSITELQNDASPRLRRPRRFSKNSSASASSTSTSTSDVEVSSLTKRLNRMTVKERQNAMYELHGIPLEDEYYDNELGFRGNKIERDPQKLQKLLLEMDRMVEERLQFSKTSYAEGEDFGEPDLFPKLNPESRQEPVKNIPTAADNNPLDNSNQGSGDPQIPAAIQQRVQFLKNDLDDKEFGEGLRLARQQNPEYVLAQRIKFLRADRYEVKLASARMIRFFDTKRELFCAPGYNGNNKTDPLGCLGRDLRLSDFSKEDLELWKKTGFLQLCGMRDRAKRPIIVMFGKAIVVTKIPTSLIMRAYLYICNLWSRDEQTQRAGSVVVAYSTFSGGSASRTGASPPAPSTKKEMQSGMNGRVVEPNNDEEVIEEYLKQTYPVISQIIKVGMSAQVRSVSMHFCIDHPKLNAQFEKIGGYMSTTGLARFRCHDASPENPESSILSAHDSNKNNSIGNSLNEDSVTPDHNSEGSSSNLETATDTGKNQPSQNKNGIGSTIDTDYNPHKELLYRLMTFGIPGETIPINDVTGEIDLEPHRAILKAIEECEKKERLLEAAASPTPTNSSSTVISSNPSAFGNQHSASLTSSNGSDKMWMSLTASTGSNTSFALFPNLEEELEEGSDHSATSLFGLDLPENLDPPPKTKKPLPDFSSSLSTPSASSSIGNARIATKPSAATSETSPRSEAPPSNASAPGIVPTSNDIIMGRGPWNRNHPGNLRLKAMLERERDRYECVNRFERMRIVDAMLNELFHDCGARFLYKPKPKAQGDEASGNSTKNSESKTGDVWLEAKRDKAHDKITHDFRNLRRQKNVTPKSNQVHSHTFSGYDM